MNISSPVRTANNLKASQYCEAFLRLARSVFNQPLSAATPVGYSTPQRFSPSNGQLSPHSPVTIVNTVKAVQQIVDNLFHYKTK